MRRRCVAMTLASAGLLVAVAGRSGFPAQDARRAGPLQRPEAAALKELVDAVAAGQLPGGDAWLRWDSHFMRAPDGRTYVPFTVTIDEAPSGFESVVMYVRVMTRANDGRSDSSGRVPGMDFARDGEVPVSVPERQFLRGRPNAPTAGEASARLNSLAHELSYTKPPFEGFFAAEPARSAAVPAVRRALVVRPGDYDVYVAVRERLRVGSRADPKSAVLRRSVTIPDFAHDELTTSSIIFADRVDAIDGRLSASQQVERPYALGTAEIVPAADSLYEPHEALSLVFFVYNVAVDAAKSPDVTVEYAFYQMSALGKLFGETAPQRFSAVHDQPAFDLKAGRRLAVTQAVPLSAFPPGDYELGITVSDNLAARSIERRVSFKVVGPR